MAAKFPLRHHPRDTDFARLPGSIFVPIWLAYDKVIGVSSVYRPSTRLVTHGYTPPSYQGEYTHPGKPGEVGPFHGPIPRLRGYVWNRVGTGSVVVEVMATVYPTGQEIPQKTSATLTVGGTEWELFDEKLYAGYLRLKVTVTVASATIMATIGLLYGPD